METDPEIRQEKIATALRVIEKLDEAGLYLQWRDTLDSHLEKIKGIFDFVKSDYSPTDFPPSKQKLENYETLIRNARDLAKKMHESVKPYAADKNFWPLLKEAQRLARECEDKGTEYKLAPSDYWDAICEYYLNKAPSFDKPLKALVQKLRGEELIISKGDKLPFDELSSHEQQYALKLSELEKDYPDALQSKKITDFIRIIGFPSQNPKIRELNLMAEGIFKKALAQAKETDPKLVVYEQLQGKQLTYVTSEVHKLLYLQLKPYALKLLEEGKIPAPPEAVIKTNDNPFAIDTSEPISGEHAPPNDAGKGKVTVSRGLAIGVASAIPLATAMGVIGLEEATRKRNEYNEGQRAIAERTREIEERTKAINEQTLDNYKIKKENTDLRSKIAKLEKELEKLQPKGRADALKKESGAPKAPQQRQPIAPKAEQRPPLLMLPLDAKDYQTPLGEATEKVIAEHNARIEAEKSKAARNR